MQTKIETRSVQVLTITMSVDEWRAVLKDPGDFLADLRLKLPTPNEDGRRARRVPKAADGRRARGGSKTLTCPRCQRSFSSPAGLGRHLKAHLDRSDAEAADPS